MHLYYIRHGDPIYSPDSLTLLGEKQAEALSKRLASVNFEKIFVSTSNRAYLTAKPTLEKLGKEPIMTDWLNENFAHSFFWHDGKWIFQHDEFIKIFNSASMFDFGKKWYLHPCFNGTKICDGAKFFSEKVYEFTSSLGFVHDQATGSYLNQNFTEKGVPSDKERRVAIFAHAGMAMIFLSTLTDIPYPLFCSRFDISHSGMTVIHFPENSKYVFPKILQLSNDSHLYHDGLPLLYNNEVRI